MVKYKSVSEEIRKRILANKYSFSTRLPNGTQFANEFDCSEITIKKALDILVNEGLIVRKRGDGSYIKQVVVDKGFSKLKGSKEYCKDLNLKLETKVVSFSYVTATKELATKLHCSVNEILYDITRIRIINDVPSVIEYIYMPALIIPNLTIEHAKDSIYSYIKDVLNLKIHSSNVTITMSCANDLERESLKLEDQSYLACVEKNVFLDDGKVFEYSIVKHICKNFVFTSNFIIKND